MRQDPSNITVDLTLRAQPFSRTDTKYDVMTTAPRGGDSPKLQVRAQIRIILHVTDGRSESRDSHILFQVTRMKWHKFTVTLSCVLHISPISSFLM
jgi:hypothetical protein